MGREKWKKDGRDFFVFYVLSAYQQEYLSRRPGRPKPDREC
ncbi:hypothetical protein CLOHYLEM_04639 [[Clostridium] hylemonae DSM 15053]|uniref:Uncharacterized protein n=1 Tax=[Clostridium] hylemonae DSM 15053 TaxID=553973 RepID=C0BXV2_9FIRM|nr:hypothetical protein CLOHYLEM_04639 [[Clostridium] hylemonae DSM 15053]